MQMAPRQQNPLDNSVRELFLEARTHFAWHDKPVSSSLLREIYDVARMGPTSTNGQPMRVIFVKSDAAKQRMKPALSPGNIEKTMNAPVTAIIGFDTTFFELFDRVAPFATERKTFYRDAPERAYQDAFRNGTLQGAYFLIVARAKGLDCGPMSGFDNDAIDAEFFPDGNVKSNFLINLGYGDTGVLHPRLYRFDFDEVCQVL